MLTVLWQTKTTVSLPLEDKHVVNNITHYEKVMTCAFSISHVIGLKQTRGYSEVGKKFRRCRGLLGRVIKMRKIYTHL